MLLLLTDYSLILGDKDLVKEALNTYLILQDKFTWLILYDEIEYAKNYDPKEPGQIVLRAREKCPVCEGYVSFIDNTLFAQCNAGHFWGKTKEGDKKMFDAN